MASKRIQKTSPTDRLMMGQFEEKHISLWIVTFDLEVSRTYIYSSLEKMKSAIGSHLLMTLPKTPNEGEVEQLVETVLEKLDDAVFSPILLNNEPLVIRRIDLDRHNQVHKVLSDCYDALGQMQPRSLFDPDSLRTQILALFS